MRGTKQIYYFVCKDMHSESNNGYPSNQQCPPQGYMPPPGQYQTPCGAYPIPHRNYPHRNSLWENIMDKTFINKKKICICLYSTAHMLKMNRDSFSTAHMPKNSEQTQNYTHIDNDRYLQTRTASSRPKI